MPLLAHAIPLQVMGGIKPLPLVFSDVPNDAWFSTYVEQAAQFGIVSGYADVHGNLTGKYGPSNPVTLAEALKIAILSAGYSQADLTSHGTVQAAVGDWAAQYRLFAHGEGYRLFSDDSAMATMYTRAATRAEVASLFADAFKRAPRDLENIVDYTDVNANQPYAGAIKAMTVDDIMVGDDRTTHCMGGATECKKTTFRPNDPVKRAEMAKVAVAARAAFGIMGSKDTASSASWYAPDSASASSTRSSFSSSSGAQASVSAQTAVVTYTDAGFSPSQVAIKQGQWVMFKNESSEAMWVASDPHPFHTDLPGFDAKTSVAAGGDWSFMFSKTGTWTFHNHLHPSFKGSVVVGQ